MPDICGNPKNPLEVGNIEVPSGGRESKVETAECDA
jgi:hypothetical protein